MVILNKRIGSAINGKPVIARNGIPLTDNQLMTFVPSLFAVDAHHSRSDRFAPIATIEVLNNLREEGYFPFFAVQTNARDESKRDFTKHMLRLRRAGDLDNNDSHEIIIRNANDGTSAWSITAGHFRGVCQNGLVCGDIERDIKIYHKGTKTMEEVLSGVTGIVNRFEEIDVYKDRMMAFNMDRKQRAQMAFAALLSIHGVENIAEVPYESTKLLKPKRSEDDKMDMWSTFNVIQENMIKGGIGGFNKQTGKPTTTREIKSIDKNIEYNSKLWKVATVLTDNMPAAVLEY